MSMKQVTGLGGVFIKDKDPKELAAWYQQFLGIGFNSNSYIDLPFTDENGKATSGYNVLSFFKSDDTYFEPKEQAELMRQAEEKKNEATQLKKKAKNR